MNKTDISAKYLAGLIDSSGSFGFYFYDSIPLAGKTIFLVFAIIFLKTDWNLAKSLQKFIGRGSVYIRGNDAIYKLTDQHTINNILIPILNTTNLQSWTQDKDYNHFKKASKIINKNLSKYEITILKFIKSDITYQNLR